MIASTTCRRSLRPSRGWAATSSLFQKLDTCVIRNRSLCTWATASEAPTEINKSRTSVESVEDELDFVTSESVGYAADREEQLLEVAEPQTAVKIRYHTTYLDGLFGPKLLPKYLFIFLSNLKLQIFASNPCDSPCCNL